jgi:UDPglucose 6-dehydrogenase
MTTTIGFIGLGKLGLDCAEVFAEKYVVRGFDIAERHSEKIIIANLQETIDASDWIFIAVPTPHDNGYDGSVPSSHLEPRDFGVDAVISALMAINGTARPKKVVLISTVLPGTVRHKLRPLLDAKHTLIYNPYLIAMGSVKWDMVNPEMLIIGTDSAGDQQLVHELCDLYAPLMHNDPRQAVGTWEEAESIKIFYNTFISAKVGLANMIQDFAMKIGNINVDVVTDALAKSTQRIMGPKYMTAGMGDAGACHPRDNIALRWLAQRYDLGYDLFDTIMLAREQQAKNLANFLFETANKNNNVMPIVIHGKAYKPDVPYCIGSYSTLIGHYLKEMGVEVTYLDPLADDGTDVVHSIDTAAVILMAHNRAVTYGYTGQANKDIFYCEIPSGSILVDPWRKLQPTDQYSVVHYGNSRP